MTRSAANPTLIAALLVVLAGAVSSAGAGQDKRPIAAIVGQANVGYLTALAVDQQSVWAVQQTSSRGYLLQIPRQGLLVSGRVRVGRLPVDVAAAGNRVWVVNSPGDAKPVVFKGNTVMAFDAHSRHLLATVHVADPTVVALTRAAAWIVSPGGHQVAEINPQALRVVGSLRLSTSPQSVTAARALLVVASAHMATTQEAESELRTYASARGQLLATRTEPFEIGQLAAQNSNIWVLSAVGGRIARFDARTLHVTARLHIRNPVSIAASKRYVWIATRDRRLFRITGEHLDGFIKLPVNAGPMVADARDCWLTDPASGRLVHVRAT
jgi:hypothetical protein